MTTRKPPSYNLAPAKEITKKKGPGDYPSPSKWWWNTEPNPRPLSEADSNRTRKCPCFWAIVLFSAIGSIPAARSGEVVRAQLDRYGWRGHCRGLFRFPVAA